LIWHLSQALSHLEKKKERKKEKKGKKGKGKRRKDGSIF